MSGVFDHNHLKLSLHLTNCEGPSPVYQHRYYNAPYISNKLKLRREPELKEEEYEYTGPIYQFQLIARVLEQEMTRTSLRDLRTCKATNIVHILSVLRLVSVCQHP